MKVNQKSTFIAIAAVAFVIILVYGLVVYLFIFPKAGAQPSGEVTTTVVALNPSNVRLDVQEGSVSADKNLIVILKMSGLGNKETVAELQKAGNLAIEINGSRADIKKSESQNDEALLITAQTNISDEKYKDFNDGKSLNLDVRADLTYKPESTASRMFSTQFQKGTRASAAGQEIVFGKKSESEVAEAKPRTGSTATPTQAPGANRSSAPANPSAPAEQARRPVESPGNYARPTPQSTPMAMSNSRPPANNAERDLIEAMKRNNILRKNSNANN